MSNCESPFLYQASATEIITDQTFEMQGSYTLPSYTIPGYPVCEPALNCSWGGWQNTDLECSWGWCCCWNTPAIPIWPSIDFGADLKCPMQISTQEQVTFTTSSTTPSPIAAAQVNFNNSTFSLTVGVDNEDTTITFILPDFTVNVESDGDFSVQVPIGDVSSTYNADGIDYTLTIDVQMLFCLVPTPPQTWINIELDCTLSCIIDGVNYEQHFSIACPCVAA